MTKHSSLVSKPEVTVILPVRNGEQFVEECVQSILSQTFKNFELLVIDDGSQDRTIAVLKSFEDHRLEIIPNSGQPGIVGALNTGISRARGDFIARIDHDDVALTRRLEMQAKILRTYPNIGLVGSWVENFGNSRKLVKFPKSSLHIKFSLFSENPMAHPSVMFRSNWDKGQKGYYSQEFSLAEDYEMWTRLLSQWDGVNIPIPLTRYRVHASQVTAHQRGERKQLARIIAAREAKRIGYRPLAENPTLFDEISWWRGLLKCSQLSGDGELFSRQTFLLTTYISLLKARLSRLFPPSSKARPTGQ